MERGDEIELAIDTVAFGGAGIGHYGKMVVFVPFTVEGDTVSVKIVAVKKRFAAADRFGNGHTRRPGRPESSEDRLCVMQSRHPGPGPPGTGRLRIWHRTGSAPGYVAPDKPH